MRFFASVCCFVVFGLGGVSLPHAATQDERYEYMETNGAMQEVFDWQLSFSNCATVVSENGDERFVNSCRLDGETTRWEIKNREMDVVAVRQGEKIVFSGLLQGQEVDRVVRIDDMPWYQPLSFSLRNFVRSQKESVDFWMIRPDSLEAVKMRATRQSLEKIEVNHREEQAVKVEVRLTGFLSAFWSCHYWFRPEDGVFLKYEGVHGPPGTVKTVIQLLAGSKADAAAATAN